MINKHLTLIIVYFLVSILGYNKHTNAQIINVDIEIPPEIKSNIVSNIEFPEVITNSGLFDIQLGDPNMGIFSITALNTQLLQIDLVVPEYLTPSFIGKNDVIPIKINSYYNSAGIDDYRDAIPLVNNTGRISFGNRNVSMNQSINWETVYIYITGSIEVGNISEGTYTGVIELIVDYE
jgi:hypothetical protein